MCRIGGKSNTSIAERPCIAERPAAGSTIDKNEAVAGVLQKELAGCMETSLLQGVNMDI